MLRDPVLTPVDSLEVHVLVDNLTDSLSIDPKHITSEFTYLWQKGMTLLAGNCLCCAAHGLSCLVTARRGGTSHTLLFDSGPDADVFEINATRLRADLGTVDGVMLSHGHWDHGGGMLRALDLIRARNGGREIPYCAHPDMFNQRGRRLPDGTVLPMEDVPGPATLARHGARVTATREPLTILDDMFHVSGEIPRVTPFETGLPNHFARADAAQEWKPDPLLIDERWLGVNVAGKGLVVFTACSHAGVVNVLKHARASFPSVKLHTVIGGLHLSGPTEAMIPDTVTALGEFDLTHIAAGHCTGWRAMAALTAKFGDSVLTPTAVGKRFRF
jgi:7,8-dihydropterin-6-yl-methyl-4-(beta-D-ribofuranosyl)aminobenzene 5'-phosphate synthase